MYSGSMTPKQRKPGQTGGGGRLGQTSNRVNSASRGGNPYRGGGGSGRKPPTGSGCLDVIIIGGLTVAGATYGLAELIF